MNNRMQDELDHEDAKKMGLLERRIREVAKQKKNHAARLLFGAGQCDL